MSAAVQVLRVDYLKPQHAQALVGLLDHYAQDPMGGGAALAPAVRERLCRDLAQIPGAASFIAWGEQGQALGLVNCFEAYSTFKAQPLLNIHDIVVLRSHRGAGIGQALLQVAQSHAQQRGCCKLTLEVLTGNQRAMQSYLRFGFAPFQLDPTAGQACLLQKWL